jgi:PucR C-terminal helix-turn-helix domain/GGDEF-like domain
MSGYWVAHSHAKPLHLGLHVNRLGDFNRAATLQQRTALRLVVSVFEACGFDETVAAYGIGSAAADQGSIRFYGARLSHWVATIDNGRPHGAEPLAPRIHDLFDLVGARWSTSAAMIYEQVFRHCPNPPLNYQATRWQVSPFASVEYGQYGDKLRLLIVETSQSCMVPQYTHLRQILSSFAELSILRRTLLALESSKQAATDKLRDEVLAEIPAFAASGNPQVLPNLANHVSDHIQQILRLFAGGEIGEFEFIKAHARQRAEQRFPLEAILHAYRCGNKVLSLWLREAVLDASPKKTEQAVSAVADFSIEYTNIISSIVASEYVAHTRLLSEAEGDRRTELLNILLSGYDESDGRVAQLLKRAGYLEQRQAYCVAAVQSTNAAEMENPARAQRIVNAISEAMTGTSIRTLAGIRNNLVIALLSDKRRQSGWTAPRSNLADRIRPLLLVLGPAVLVGISTDHPSTSYLPKAVHQATIALDFANVANRVVQFSNLPIRDLLIHHGADYVEAAPPQWLATLLDADAKAEGTLVETLRAMANADLNLQKAARILGRHPNTIYARIERVKTLTGLDGQRYHDITELLLAADCWRGRRI